MKVKCNGVRPRLNATAATEPSCSFFLHTCSEMLTGACGGVGASGSGWSGSAPHKDLSDYYEKMSGKGESASEAHRSAKCSRVGPSLRWASVGPATGRRAWRA